VAQRRARLLAITEEEEERVLRGLPIPIPPRNIIAYAPFAMMITLLLRLMTQQTLPLGIDLARIISGKDNRRYYVG